jgi:hypothetical protein
MYSVTEGISRDKIEYENPETPGEDPRGARFILALNSAKVGGADSI